MEVPTRVGVGGAYP
jgi:hypothetical protein